MKAAQYRTITAASPAAVDESVNIHLKQGWELYGNPYAIMEKGENISCQALVKEFSEAKKPQGGTR